MFQTGTPSNPLLHMLRGPFLLVLVLCGPLVQSSLAQTTVCGPQSGSWTSAGSPYLVACDVTVPAGQSLTIGPGVTVLLFAGTSILVDGELRAIGTKTERILFDEVASGQPWNRILVSARGGSPPTSRFENCDFRNASTAIYAYVQGQFDGWTQLDIEVSDCTFEGTATGFYGEAYGWNWYQFGTPHRRHARLNPVIEGCTFSGGGQALDFNIHGSCQSWCGGAESNPVVRNCLFRGVGGVLHIAQNGYSNGTAAFVSNTVLASGGCIDIGDRFPATIANNIFYGSTSALQLAGLHDVQYNSFFANGVDCTGCAVSFGSTVWTNANGDPSDLFYNVFMDPGLEDLSQGRLACDSPCAEAGTAAVPVSLPVLDHSGRDLRVIGGSVDIGADEIGATWDFNGPAVPGGGYVSFTATSSGAQNGNDSFLLLSLGDGSSSGGIPLLDGTGRCVLLDRGALFRLWVRMPTAFTHVSLNGCNPGSTTLPFRIPATTPIGLRVYYSSVTWDSAGAFTSISETRSFTVE